MITEDASVSTRMLLIRLQVDRDLARADGEYSLADDIESAINYIESNEKGLSI